MAAPDKSKSKRPQYLVEGEKIPLDYPFRLNGRDITEVTILPPSYSVVICLWKHKINDFFLISKLINENLKVISAIKWPDIEKILKCSEKFLSKHLDYDNAFDDYDNVLNKYLLSLRNGEMRTIEYQQKIEKSKIKVDLNEPADFLHSNQDSILLKEL